MASNPLQQYFRQPKIFLKLPSMGIYNAPGDLVGSVENMPVFGMTGMDEILMKTPDALFTGESTVQVIKSCCPNIVNPWALTNLDVDTVLVAIRIATYSNTMSIKHTCNKCQTENEYDIDLDKFTDHFNQCVYDNTVVLPEIIVKLRPLTYQQVTEFNIENYSMQKTLYQLDSITDEQEKQRQISEIYKLTAALQNKILVNSIEHVELITGVVTEKEFITEWIENCDSSIIDTIRKQLDKNNAAWKIPPTKVQCENCKADDEFTVDLDQASFFAVA